MAKGLKQYGFKLTGINKTPKMIMESVKSKAEKYRCLLDGETRKRIPIDDNSFPILEIITEHKPNFISNNAVTETAKYVLINGQKLKKNKFLTTFFPSLKNKFDKDTTTGRLILSVDSDDFFKCSHEQFVSWRSCFSPDGCYNHSVPAFICAPTVLIAIITNSDESKIIGRRWIIIVGKLIFFLKSYGTFPINYQRALSTYISNHYLGLDKKDVRIYENDDARDVCQYINSSSYDTAWGYEHPDHISGDDDRSDYDGNYEGRFNYVDNPAYLVFPKEISDVVEHIRDNENETLIPFVKMFCIGSCYYCGTNIYSETYGNDRVLKDNHGNYYCSEEHLLEDCIFSPIEKKFIRKEDTASRKCFSMGIYCTISRNFQRSSTVQCTLINEDTHEKEIVSTLCGSVILIYNYIRYIIITADGAISKNQSLDKLKELLNEENNN